MQYARAVCRRAERTVVPLIRDEQVDATALKFLNRFLLSLCLYYGFRTSDLLFVLGRYSCMKTQQEEVTYMRPKEFVSQRWQRKKLS